jgi:hypothetical protein
LLLVGGRGVGYAVDQSELARDLVAGVTEKREVRLVLVVHEERMLHGLRGNEGDGGPGLLEAGTVCIHGFELAAAERVPSSANEAENQAATGEEFGGSDVLSVVVKKIEGGGLRPRLQGAGGNARALQVIDDLSVDGLR